MARIRTIKPEFFTSEDVVALSPLARLLYIAIWCEADKEGRLLWKPLTFKMRYFPVDNCDIQELCEELISQGVVRLYGEGLAYIPAFAKHQHINPRETASTLPDPHASTTRQPRVPDASPRDSDAQVGREGKGRERNTRDASRPPDGFAEFWACWPKSDRKGGRAECVSVWEKAGLEIEAPTIIDHVKAMAKTEGWTKQGGSFVPAPVVYLRGRRWDGAELSEAGSSDIFADIR
jgi:hypothetical protein